MVDHFRNRIEFLLKDALIPKKTAVNQLEIRFARALPHSFEKKQLDLKQLERSLDKVGKTILIDKNSEVIELPSLALSIQVQWVEAYASSQPFGPQYL